VCVCVCVSLCVFVCSLDWKPAMLSFLLRPLTSCAVQSERGSLGPAALPCKATNEHVAARRRGSTDLTGTQRASRHRRAPRPPCWHRRGPDCLGACGPRGCWCSYNHLLSLSNRHLSHYEPPAPVPCGAFFPFRCHDARAYRARLITLTTQRLSCKLSNGCYNRVITVL